MLLNHYEVMFSVINAEGSEDPPSSMVNDKYFYKGYISLLLA
nr:MAG TPA: hypothetical protein [Caudoviricetes sp.]